MTDTSGELHSHGFIDVAKASPYCATLIMAVRVKICGLTNLEDARLAIDAGADALGFIFFSGSPRYVTLAAAARIIAQLPPFTAKVGVFVDETVECIIETVRQTGIDTVQLHGGESAKICEELAQRRMSVIKAFRVKDASSLQSMNDFHASAFLLDSYVTGQHGGTGARFNWDLAVQAKASGTPIILAGGLIPENIQDAVAKVRPYGVDVSSGVESSPGKKDATKVREFIERAKRA